jgi:DNA-binding response OmpR family regulator
MPDILIVEDGLHERERLIKLFGGAGFTVAAAECAADAERLLTLQQFKLAVLDIGLSDRSGSHLFELIRRSANMTHVIVLTGNPSVHLKQRFIEDGAAAYIVKASPASENEPLLATVKSLIGNAEGGTLRGIPLSDFLQLYLTENSRALFLDATGQVSPCPHCASRNFLVVFDHRTQLPPVVEGRVICSKCLCELNPEII